MSSLKIAVAIKQVANLDDEFELLDDGSGVDPDFLEFELNEWDAFSLETALQLRDPAGAGDVIAVTVGDNEADDVLLNALARGADRAIRVWDDDLAGADALTVAKVLAATIGPESPDIVLCGVQSSDAVNSATGVALAGYLGLPHVAVVTSVDLAGTTATIERELEGGAKEVMRIDLPALFTIQTGINEPRYATLRAIKQARDKPLTVRSLEDIGLGSTELRAVSGARLRGLAHPERGAGADILEGSATDVADKIMSLIRERVA